MNAISRNLEIMNLYLQIGGLQILTDIDLNINGPGIVALIGPNGAGKTSLLNCISGIYRPTCGQVLLNGKDITTKSPQSRAYLGLARIFQNSELFNEMTVQENLLLGRHIHMRANIISVMFKTNLARREEEDSQREVENILEILKLTDKRNQLVGWLPHGIRRKVEIARALLMEPFILMLDEPITGMTGVEIEELVDTINFIQESRELLIIFIDHHMGVVLSTARRVIVMNFGRIIADGSAEEIKEDPEVINAYLGEKRL